MKKSTQKMIEEAKLDKFNNKGELRNHSTRFLLVMRKLAKHRKLETIQELSKKNEKI